MESELLPISFVCQWMEFEPLPSMGSIGALPILSISVPQWDKGQVLTTFVWMNPWRFASEITTLKYFVVFMYVFMPHQMIKSSAAPFTNFPVLCNCASSPLHQSNSDPRGNVSHSSLCSPRTCSCSYVWVYYLWHNSLHYMSLSIQWNCWYSTVVSVCNGWHGFHSLAVLAYRYWIGDHCSPQIVRQ